MFEVKRFNSGEWDVRLIDCKNFNNKIHWNWFKYPDVMVPIMMADCIRYVFGNVSMSLDCPYLPYCRQDRVFSVGQGIPNESMLSILGNYFSEINVLSRHSRNPINIDLCTICQERVSIDWRDEIIVFPDKNACFHFDFPSNYVHVSISKERSEKGITSHIDKSYEIKGNSKILICDDICDGGRTFIEAAKICKCEFPENLGIELLVAHGFMTNGLNYLKDSGISKIWIANSDSYEYLTEKYNDTDYIKQWGKK